MISIQQINTSILALIFFSSSFDVFLNLTISSFTLRFVFLLIILFITLNFFVSKQLIYSFIGYKYLFPWLILQILFVFNTTFISRNVLYLLWMLLYTFFLMSMVSTIKSKALFYKVIWVYLKSFFFVAAFGLIQFTLGLFGFDILISQWWVPGILPRINGFSYEPSFFSTYLMIGWGVSFYIYLTKKSHALKVFRNNGRILFLISTVIILSSSRIGIFIVVICFLATFIYRLIFTFNFLRKLYSFFFLLCLYFVLIQSIEFKKYSFFLTGIGVISELGDQSLKGRFERAYDTFDVFLANPVIGVGLGGIPSGIGLKNNLIVKNQSQIKASSYHGMEKGYWAGLEGQNVFIELLASSGILGYPLILIFFWVTFIKPLKLTKLNLRRSDKYLLRAMLFAGFLIFVMLFFNQNILRPWLWIHLSLINVFYFILIKELNENLH
jgi:O-antigen ligase